jgi:hypothetical protein
MVKQTNRWMESSDVIPMFPTLVWKLQIEGGLRDTLAAGILEALTDMRRGRPPLEPGRGWQSGQTLHEREDFRELLACIRRGIASILRSYGSATTRSRSRRAGLRFLPRAAATRFIATPTTS